MANSSIPNSSPANGRISIRSSRRSRKQNSASISVAESRLLRLFNARRSTLNAKRSIQKVGRWVLDVGRWAFSLSGRVKGAWWPSRSSKPSSLRKWRGRFDSYPLRIFFLVILSGAKRSRRIPLWYSKLISSGFLDFARNDKLIEGGEPHVT